MNRAPHTATRRAATLGLLLALVACSRGGFSQPIVPADGAVDGAAGGGDSGDVGQLEADGNVGGDADADRGGDAWAADGATGDGATAPGDGTSPAGDGTMCLATGCQSPQECCATTGQCYDPWCLACCLASPP